MSETSPELWAELDEAEAEAAHERNIHFNGHYPTDPYIEHGEFCIDSCPYDTPEQAQERAESFRRAEEARYAAERELEPGG
jgi:hypothetical protein